MKQRGKVNILPDPARHMTWTVGFDKTATLVTYVFSYYPEASIPALNKLKFHDG